MRKGTSAIDNIQTLKWCLAYGIECNWNMLFSFPGERIEWYDAVAQAIPRLMHLPPPTGLFRTGLHRFSPLFERARAMGIKVLGPRPFMELAFADVRPDLVERLAFDFRYEIDGRPADLDERIKAMLKPLIARWRGTFAAEWCTRSIVHGPGESLLVEGPLLHPGRAFRLKGPPLRLLRACESIHREDRVLRLLADEPPAPVGELCLDERGYREAVEQICSSAIVPEEPDEVPPSALVAAAEHRGWLYREAGRLLSLPVNQAMLVRSPRFRFWAALRR
jgi:hypothetical protein